MPLKISVHVEAEQAFGAENGNDAFAVGGRCGIAVGSFGVALDARNGFETKLVPKQFSAVFIEAKQAPLVRLLFFVRRAIAVNASFEIGSAAGFNGGGDIDVVLPDDRAGVAQARNGFLPANVLAGFKVPFGGRRLVGEAGAVRAAKLGPVGGRGESRNGENRQRQCQGMGQFHQQQRVIMQPCEGSLLFTVTHDRSMPKLDSFFHGESRERQ